MNSKYESVGLDSVLIEKSFPDIEEYEETVNFYLNDPFFSELEDMLEDEDYAMAKDAVKGLYILAENLHLYPLYEALLEVFEDLEYEEYKDVLAHFKNVKEVHARIRGIFYV